METVVNSTGYPRAADQVGRRLSVEPETGGPAPKPGGVAVAEPTRAIGRACGAKFGKPLQPAAISVANRISVSTAMTRLRQSARRAALHSCTSHYSEDSSLWSLAIVSVSLVRTSGESIGDSRWRALWFRVEKGDASPREPAVRRLCSPRWRPDLPQTNRATGRWPSPCAPGRAAQMAPARRPAVTGNLRPSRMVACAPAERSGTGSPPRRRVASDGAMRRR